MKTFLVELTGKTPLMHHRISDEEKLKLIGYDKSKKKKVKDTSKSPREIAESHAYKDDSGVYYIPSEYISGAFSGAAADYKQTSSRKSYKAIAGGIFKPMGMGFDLLNPDDSKKIKSSEVDIRIAKNRNAGKGCAVAVCRPRFDKWKIRLNVEVDDDLISPDKAQEILEDSGRRFGVGSYRVENNGPFGTFSVTMFKEEKQIKKDGIFK